MRNFKLNVVNSLRVTMLAPAFVAAAFATPAMAEAIHHEITGSRLEIFEHASHLSPLEQPEKFQRAVSNFLDTL